ncbi:hypothetical protein LPLM1_00056 [Listeria phage LPML1]|nr:hypothetical protein LPLM1_00056 [Listeria phage LPML1]
MPTQGNQTSTLNLFEETLQRVLTRVCILCSISCMPSPAQCCCTLMMFQDSVRSFPLLRTGLFKGFFREVFKKMLTELTSHVNINTC